MLIYQDFTVDRTKYIGGSDIGAILGLSKFRTPVEVWMEKTGKEMKKVDSLPLRFGSFAEEFVASEYTRSTGFELLHDESIYLHPQHNFMSAHIDRFVLGDGKALPPSRILECKTANPFSSGDWGAAGSDQVPMSYLCQCIWYMAITDIDKTDLAVLFGNSDFRVYEIARDKELEDLVLQRAHIFWDEFVLKDLPPPASNEQDYQTLFSKSASEKSVEATKETVELLSRLGQLNQEIEVKEEEVSFIKQSIMHQMGEAELLSHQGQVLATWKTPKQSYRLDSRKLALDHPDLITQYQAPIQNSRRLVIKSLVI